MRRGLLLAVTLAAINTPSVFATEAPMATFFSTDVSADRNALDQEIGIFRIRFRITAPDQDDIYLRGIHWPDNFAILRSGVSVVNPRVTSILFASDNMSGDTPGLYEIRAGESRNFNFESVLAPKTSGIYACQLNRLEWALGQNEPGNWMNLNRDDFTTPYLALTVTPEPATLALLGLVLPLVRRRR